MQLPLPQGEVHLWYDVLDPEQDSTRDEIARQSMSDEEWARASRFTLAEGRREFVAGRLMIRSVLSRYAAVTAAEWQFSAGDGRPRIVEPARASALRFNLSHANGLVACVVSAHHDVGIDVERLGRHAPLTIAESRFAPSEIASLRALPQEDRPRRFLEYWTLKESYLKARGLGLSVPLDRFAFDLTRPGRPRITFQPGFDDDATVWQFDRLFVGTDHVVAVATCRRATPVVSIVVRAFDGAAESSTPAV
jgi:4'-phosphopantetheinyl transferase